MSVAHSKGCIALGAAFTAASLLSGCGLDPYETVPVTGRVTCEGKPAWGGTVIFQPIASEATGRPLNASGRSASGLIQEDGSFTLSVPAAGGAKDAEGALIGPHRVSFLMPKTTPWEMDPADRQLPPEEQEQIKAELAKRPVYKELSCGPKISPDQVEVKSGENAFEFTLAPK